MQETKNKGTNIILTLASGYKYYHLEPFLKSLLISGYKGRVICFVNSLSAYTIEKLNTVGINTIEYENNYPFFNNSNLSKNVQNPGRKLSPNSLRYFLYEAFLKSSVEEYNLIMHTDIRDVIFQKDPFQFDFNHGIYCFYEDETSKIKDSKHNSYWIKHGFGNEIFERIKNENISCSGITIGTNVVFMQYLEEMTHFLSRLPDVGGLDQGVHNFLINSNVLTSLNKLADDEGPISTISSFKPQSRIRINKSGLVLNHRNEIVNVVHQYDRHWKLLWKHNKREYLEKKINLVKRFFLEIWKQKKVTYKMIRNLYIILFGQKIPTFTW